MSHSDNYYPPVSPFDVVGGKPKRTVGFQSIDLNEKETYINTRIVRTDSDSSKNSGLATPRKTRFAEATTVDSPAKGTGEFRSPFANPPKMANNDHKPSDVGFGYIADNQPVEQHANIPTTYGRDGQPLKSALKTPGTAARLINPMSPTFREEEMLEREEEKTEKQQAKDLVSFATRISRSMLTVARKSRLAFEWQR